MSRSRPVARAWTRHIEPCGCNPKRGIVCAGCRAAFRASETCWHCGDGEPIGMREGKPICEKCSAAVRESSPRLPVAS